MTIEFMKNVIVHRRNDFSLDKTAFLTIHGMSQNPAQSPPAANIRERLRRLTPYFGSQKGIWAVAVLATLVGALTEPMIPALFQPLLDKGFSENKLPLWIIPAVVVGLFAVRGLANFVAQYALSRITNDGMEKLRSRLFSQLMKADLSLFPSNRPARCPTPSCTKSKRVRLNWSRPSLP